MPAIRALVPGRYGVHGCTEISVTKPSAALIPHPLLDTMRTDGCQLEV